MELGVRFLTGIIKDGSEREGIMFQMIESSREINVVRGQIRKQLYKLFDVYRNTDVLDKVRVLMAVRQLARVFITLNAYREIMGWSDDMVTDYMV